MANSPEEHDHPLPPARFCFTPWKAGLAVSSLLLCIGTFYLLDALLPGTLEPAIRYKTKGVEVFEVFSRKSEWMKLIFVLTFFGYLPLLMFLFWKPYSRSREYRFYLAQSEANNRAHPAWRAIAYCLYYVLLAFLAIILFAGLVVRPSVTIHRVSVADTEATFHSLFWSWQIPRDAIRDVLVRSEHDLRGQQASASYEAVVVIDDGRKFETSQVRAIPAGGNDDRRFQAFFEELRAELLEP